MKYVAPDYYLDFACIAGKCRHSCCIGWEIDIDAESREYYRDVPGEIGRRLKENIDDGGDVPHFRLAENERCPFLNGDGLCDLILELGEESLCQICADHPRFRNFFSDREEIGLGMCCEEAARLILSREDAVSLVVLEDDGESESLDEDEMELLQLRSELSEIARDRTMPVEMRVRHMLEYAGLPAIEPDYRRWAAFLKKLERLDEAWTGHLIRLENASAAALPDAQEWKLPLEQLLVYLLYRHLPGALEDGELAGRIAFVALMWHILRTMLGIENSTFANFAELCRLYSSEIEYSDENIGAILEELHRAYPEL